MTTRRIWYTPVATTEYEADAYRLPIGWLIRYSAPSGVRWAYALRLNWSNHFDRV